MGQNLGYLVVPASLDHILVLDERVTGQIDLQFYRVQGLAFRAWSLRFADWGLGFMDQGVGLKP
jgi:hypothetical protein